MAAIACHVNCSTNPQFYAEMTGSPRFLGKPQCIHALLSDSGGTLTQMPKCVQVLPSAPKHAVGSPDASLSGLNHTAYMLPVHASQKGYPSTAQHPIPAVGTLGRRGFITRWVAMKSFRDMLHLLLISQA